MPYLVLVLTGVIALQFIYITLLRRTNKSFSIELDFLKATKKIEQNTKMW
ncbi:MAG: hypothetical protein RR424_08655 [Oscillospiraceae bacterium]